MKRVPLFVTVLLAVILVFVGCQKEPLDYGNVGVLNLGLKRGYKTAGKSVLESFDARVTIYYGAEDTVAYNCRFVDTDGDGRYTNDPSVLESIYVRREVGFWVGVRAVIQGDTVMGMSEPTHLLYLSEENPVLDVNIVLFAGYPRIVVSSNTGFDGESVLLYGEVIEGAEMLEQYAFAVKRGQLSDEEKLFWSRRVLSDAEYQELFNNGDYDLIEAELDYNEPNRFVGQMEMYDLDSAEYSVVALAALRMNEDDSIPAVIHSSVVSMTISEGGLIMEDYIYLDEPYWDGDTVILMAYYTGNSEVYECGFVFGFSEYQLTDSLMCRETSQPFSYTLFGLQPNTTYYYRAYVKTADGLIESEETMQFIVPTSEQEPSYSQPTGYIDGYAYVDLGLPSGTLWAYTNIGANTPEDYGNYYAWGETETKETYDWETYLYCNGDSATLTKYCNDESYGLDGYTDSLTTLDSEDDVASVSWGGSWRMPTHSEIQELFDNCSAVWTEINGIAGVLFSGTNENSIFLSAAGNLYVNNLNGVGANCYYWSSTLYSNGTSSAWHLRFNSDDSGMRIISRFCGFSVRPVCVQSKKKRK